MNVLEKMREVLTEQPKISEFLADEVNIDFTEETDHNYGLSSVGDNRLKKFITGKEERINNMELYAVNQSATNYDRIESSSFLLDLGYYLESLKGQEITAGERTGHIKEITVGNGMAFAYSEDRQYITYSLQIKVIYDLGK